MIYFLSKKFLNVSTTETLDIISKIDSFYNSAWEKLIIVGTLSFAVVGVIVPLIIQWYQKKTLKVNEDILKNEIRTQIKEIKDEIIGMIDAKLAEKISEFEEKITKINAATTAKTFHLQGNSQKDSLEALSDYVYAAKYYLICQDYANLQIVLSIISDVSLVNRSLEEVKDLIVSHNCDLDEVLTEIVDNDQNDVFTQVIRKIKLQLTKIPKTIVEKEVKKE